MQKLFAVCYRIIHIFACKTLLGTSIKLRTQHLQGGQAWFSYAYTRNTLKTIFVLNSQAEFENNEKMVFE